MDMSKKKNIKEMVEYTYRDIGQEYLMKKKVVRVVIIAIITTIALAVFVALYIDERQKVQATYKKQYEIGLRAVIEDINSYQKAEGDLEFRYRRLVSDMNMASSFLFLLDGKEDNKKNIQELYTVLLRYPEQSVTKLDDMKVAIDDILQGLDKGYDEAQKIVDIIDKKGQ